MKNFVTKIGFQFAAVAVTALTLTAFAAAQEPAATYSWGTPAAVQSQNITPAALPADVSTNLQSDYRGRGSQDVLGTINDTIYGRPHTGRTIAIIGGSAAGGAILGGVTYGKKGAVIGAIGGGLAGWAIDRATRHKTIFGY